jgi:hypothetical protein
VVDDRLAGLEHAREDGLHLLPEPGCHLRCGPADVRLDREPVDLGEGLVEPNEAELGVVEPEADRRVLEQRVEAGQRPLQLLAGLLGVGARGALEGMQPGPLGLGLLALGDVDAHADPQRVVGAGDGVAAPLDPAHRAIGEDDAVLHRDVAAFPHRAADDAEHALAVVGVDTLEEGVEGPRERARLEPEEPLELG